MKGLYIHIPFCAKKCEYCDFYSLNYNKALVEKYVEAVCNEINTLDFAFQTVYFGGGTPSLIGYENLIKILNCVKHTDNAEITVECNPKTVNERFFNEIAKAGFNRVSLGLQSVNENELSFLTRKHSAEDVKKAVELAYSSGIKNVSLDVMTGLENQTWQSLKRTLDFCISLNVTHISSYMLKIEKETPFAYKQMKLPSDDSVSDMYLLMCDYLEKNGYSQYEISNFAQDGFESRHNLLYWNCDEYVGVGAAAHSYFDGKRSYYPRNIDYYIGGGERIFDCFGGDLEEYVMLALRLTKGVLFDVMKKRGFILKRSFKEKLCSLVNAGFMVYNDKGFNLTKKGFLVSNLVIADILEALL